MWPFSKRVSFGNFFAQAHATEAENDGSSSRGEKLKLADSAAAWKRLTDEEKKPFEALAAKDRARYEQENLARDEQARQEQRRAVEAAEAAEAERVRALEERMAMAKQAEEDEAAAAAKLVYDDARRVVDRVNVERATVAALTMTALFAQGGSNKKFESSALGDLPPQRCPETTTARDTYVTLGKYRKFSSQPNQPSLMIMMKDEFFRFIRPYL